MTILVCGGRDWTDRETICEHMMHFTISDASPCIIDGAAPGADSIANEIAITNGYTFKRYPADWKTNGKAAGPIRNALMLRDGKPDYVLAFPTRKSIGTWDMIRKSVAAGVPVTIIPEPKLRPEAPLASGQQSR